MPLSLYLVNLFKKPSGKPAVSFHVAIATSTVQAPHLSLFSHVAWTDDSANDLMDDARLSTRVLEETIRTFPDHMAKDSSW